MPPRHHRPATTHHPDQPSPPPATTVGQRPQAPLSPEQQPWRPRPAMAASPAPQSRPPRSRGRDQPPGRTAGHPKGRHRRSWPGAGRRCRRWSTAAPSTRRSRSGGLGADLANTRADLDEASREHRHGSHLRGIGGGGRRGRGRGPAAHARRRRSGTRGAKVGRPGAGPTQPGHTAPTASARPDAREEARQRKRPAVAVLAGRQTSGGLLM
jgi:hypothetical protein